MEEQLADREEHGGPRICHVVAASKQFTVHLLRGDAKRKSAQNAIELLGQKCKIRKRAEHPIRVTWAQSGEAETSSQSEYEESNPGARHCFFGLSGRCASEKANPTTVSLYARSRSYQDRPV